MALAAALRGWTATQRNVVLAAYLGWTLDAFDFLMITLIAKDITATFHTPATGIGLILTGTLALRPVGAFIFGRLADKFGRRPVLMFNVCTRLRHLPRAQVPVWRCDGRRMGGWVLACHGACAVRNPRRRVGYSS